MVSVPTTPSSCLLLLAELLRALRIVPDLRIFELARDFARAAPTSHRSQRYLRRSAVRSREVRERGGDLIELARLPWRNSFDERCRIIAVRAHALATVAGLRVSPGRWVAARVRAIMIARRGASFRQARPSFTEICNADPSSSTRSASTSARNVAGDTPLLWILRDNLNLTGTKYGCGMALCGACTVHIDGQPTRSCQTPLSSLKPGVEITTIEGLKTKEAQAVQAAWEKLDVPQCGYCQSGQVMSAAALLAKNKKPDRRRHRRGDGRQRLPLRDLRPHPRRDQGSGEDARLNGDSTMNPMRMRPPCRPAGPMSRRVLPQGDRGRRRRPDARHLGRRRCRAGVRARQDRRQRRCRHVRAERVPAHRPRQHRHRRRQAPRDGPGHLHRVCRRSSPKSSTRRGRRCASKARPPTRSATTTCSGAARRAPAARRRWPTRSSSTGRPAPPRARCWSRRRRSSGMCPPDSIQVKNGVVIARERQEGDVRRARRRRRQASRCPATVKLKDPKDFVYIGKHVPRTDSQAKSNGTATFTQDVKLPGHADRRRRASAALRRQT